MNSMKNFQDLISQSSLLMKHSNQLLLQAKIHRTSRSFMIEKARKIEYAEYHITREIVKANRDKTFLFGDNLLKRGLGGQAKEMRYEWNAVGIPTKKRPDNHPTAFFTDDEYFTNIDQIEKALAEIPIQGIVVIPKNGIGTGFAKLPEYAPATYSYLIKRLQNL